MRISLVDITNYVGLFFLGTINNFSYCVISSASQDIAEHFGQVKNIGFIPWANICMGLLFQILNAGFLQGVPHNWRIVMACALHMAGLLGLGLTVWLSSWGFWLSLLAIMSIGSASTLGEIVILGFLKVFDNDIVSAFSSGTGMAGVAGSFTYLFLQFIFDTLFGDKITGEAWPLSVKFLSFTPLVLIFLFIWFSVLRTPNKSDSQIRASSQDINANSYSPRKSNQANIYPESEIGFEDTSSPAQDYQSRYPDIPVYDDSEIGREKDSLLKQKKSNSKVQEVYDVFDPTQKRIKDQEYDVEEYFIENIKQETFFQKIISQIIFIGLCFKKCWWRSLNLMLVYFLEYVIGIGCANAATYHYRNSSNMFESNAFRILGFCYQFGVLISRSSLKFIKIKRIYFITLLQFIMFILWTFEGKLQFIPVYILFPLMLFVGLLGGSSYVQVYYLILSDKTLTEEEREMCVNICAIGVTIGITSASLFIMLLNSTLYNDVVS